MAYEFKVIASPVGKLKLVASHDKLVAILWEPSVFCKNRTRTMNRGSSIVR
jgi:hypothetical protein